MFWTTEWFEPGRQRPQTPGADTRLRRSSRRTSRNSGKSLNNRPFTRLLRSARAENLLDSSWIACRGSEQLDVVPEASQFADHLPRAYFLGLGAHGGTTFLVADLLVKNLPDQTAQSVSDGADRLGMAEARDQPAVHDVEDRPFRLHRGIGSLVVVTLN